MTDGTSTYLYCYDGNGNVGQLVNAATGEIAAHYEYDPFGKTLVADETLTNANPFRFSTKFRDTETGLYYYGFRYYEPGIGRWLSRDPLGEEGGYNLYAFIFNSPIFLFDPFGLREATISAPPEKNFVQKWIFDYEIIIQDCYAIEHGFETPGHVFFKWGYDGVETILLGKAIGVVGSKVKQPLQRIITKGSETFKVTFRITIAKLDGFVKSLPGPLANNAGSTPIFTEVPIMARDAVKKFLSETYEKSTKWAYSIHEHHIRSKWLLGKPDGPVMRVRGWEHITDLEPALWEYIKKEIPAITNRSPEAVRSLMKKGIVTEEEITEKLFDFYKKRYPQLTDEEIMEALIEGL
jgi:RHS repeat-associated protein